MFLLFNKLQLQSNWADATSLIQQFNTFKWFLFIYLKCDSLLAEETNTDQNCLRQRFEEKVITNIIAGVSQDLIHQPIYSQTASWGHLYKAVTCI